MKLQVNINLISYSDLICRCIKRYVTLQPVLTSMDRFRFFLDNDPLQECSLYIVDFYIVKVCHCLGEAREINDSNGNCRINRE